MATITAIDLPGRRGTGTLGRPSSTRALEVPAMNHDLEHVMKITHRPPIVMVEGSGSWLRDSEGRAYLDFVQPALTLSQGEVDRMIDILGPCLGD
jgi:acetylornithine/succinyldiaminopimelate/putrescine aminotransferase